MTNKPKLTRFKSEITSKFFGEGMYLETVTREKKELYLSRIARLMERQSWLSNVVDGYLGDPYTWSDETLLKWLRFVRDDIHAIQHSMINKEGDK